MIGQRGSLVMPLVIVQYKSVIGQPDSEHTGCIAAADICAAVTDITAILCNVLSSTNSDQLQYFCKGTIAAKKLLNILYKISCLHSAMQNGTQNGGWQVQCWTVYRTVDDRFSAGQYTEWWMTGSVLDSIENGG
jgi:hypothetical protein